MNAKHTSFAALRLGVALISVGVVGCSTAMRTFERATPRESMARQVDDTAAQVAEVNGRVDGALQALNDLVNHPSRDLQRQFRTYTDALNKLESAHDKLRANVEAMESEGREYLVTWDREIATIQDQDLRNSTAERRTEVSERMDTLHESFIDARESLAPLLHRLQEIETALKVDLTSAGVESVRPTVGNANDVEPARDALRQLANAFREAAVSLAAAQPMAVGDDDRD